MKRGLGDELVITPYATALAAMYFPHAAVENFEYLESEGLWVSLVSMKHLILRQSGLLKRSVWQSCAVIWHTIRVCLW